MHGAWTRRGRISSLRKSFDLKVVSLSTGHFFSFLVVWVSWGFQTPLFPKKKGGGLKTIVNPRTDTQNTFQGSQRGRLGTHFLVISRVCRRVLGIQRGLPSPVFRLLSGEADAKSRRRRRRIERAGKGGQNGGGEGSCTHATPSFS